jgi:hypothetical protein
LPLIYSWPTSRQFARRGWLNRRIPASKFLFPVLFWCGLLAVVTYYFFLNAPIFWPYALGMIIMFFSILASPITRRKDAFEDFVNANRQYISEKFFDDLSASREARDRQTETPYPRDSQD